MPAVRCTDRAQHLAGQRGASREGWRHSDPATVSLRKRADARGCICRAGHPRGGRAESHAAAQGRRRAPAPRRPAKRQRGSTRVRAGCTLPRRFRVSDADSSPLPLLRISSASSSPVPCPPVAQALSRICSAVRRPRRRRPRSPCSMQGASTSSWTACRNPAPADATAPLPTTAAHALHPQPPPLPTARSLDRGSAN